jgi:hypothetical protein
VTALPGVRPLAWLPCATTTCRWIATGAWFGVTGSIVITLLVWASRGFPPQPMAFAQGVGGAVSIAVVALAYASMGAILAIRIPRNPTGWLFLVVGISAGLLAWVNLLVADALESLRPTPVITLGMAWLFSSLVVPVVVTLLMLVCLIFPTGSLPSSAWRRVALLGTGGASLVAIAAALDPHGLLWYPSLPNPWAVPAMLGPMVEAIRTAGIALAVLGMALAAASLLWRYRCADEELHDQLKLIVLAGIGMAITTAPFLLFVHFPLGASSETELLLVVAAVGACLLPIAVAFAIARHHLFGNQAIISRSIVYLPLVAISGGLFVSTVALIQRLFVSTTGTTSDIAIVVATLFAATAMTTVRRAIDGFADRRFKAAAAAPDADGPVPPSRTSHVGSLEPVADPAQDPRIDGESESYERLILQQLARIEGRLAEVERRTASPLPVSHRAGTGPDGGAR